MRRLAQIIDEMEGQGITPSWRIMLDSDSFFLAAIMSTIILRVFRLSDLKYTRKSDPLVHIECFNNMIRAQSFRQA